MQDSRDRFEALLAPHQDMLRGYVFRMIGHPPDAEDLLQDVTVKAFERLDSLRNEDAFKSWLFRIATRTCVDHLRKKKRWRPFSQRYAELECAENDELRQEVVDTTHDAEFAYDVREHIAFCFTCVGRSLEPEEQAAIVLREIFGFTNREAGQILGMTESVLRHHLASGRRSMEETYDGLCRLVSKEGLCWQCGGFRSSTREERRGPSLPVLPDDRDEAWKARIALAREKHFVDGVAQTLHDLLFRRITRLEDAAE